MSETSPNIMTSVPTVSGALFTDAETSTIDPVVNYLTVNDSGRVGIGTTSLDYILPDELGGKNPVRRLVQIYVVDPDEDVEAERSVVLGTDRFMTDKSNLDLYITELNLKLHIETHNEWRKSKDLEEITIDDLHIKVVNLATFE